MQRGTQQAEHHGVAEALDARGLAGWLGHERQLGTAAAVARLAGTDDIVHALMPILAPAPPS
jgi:hypothetical protein